ncbi:hypothetical protein OPT61_g2213 [Boeremia exigua]|uniref:Uncharacterized protein n=1 Tax=Boeremia exigua TaxID=749465 RepID=A0ACC2IMB2_9PLEO|nr:hypothetical protein OPT61_g2213 [Boeremia exigua]
MASFNYMNNTAPFWDFLASLEQQGNNHPFFGQNRQDRSNEDDHDVEDEAHRSPLFDPFGLGNQRYGGPGGLPHRGPPPGAPPHHDEENSPHNKHNEGRNGEKGGNDRDQDHDNNDNDNGEGPSNAGSDGEGGRRCGRGRHGHCGGRRGRHGFGGRGGFGPHHGGPGHHGPRGHHNHRGFNWGPPPPPEGPRGGPHGHHHPGRPGGRSTWGWNGPFSGPCHMRTFGEGAEVDPASIFAPFFDAFIAEHPSNKNNETAARENEDFTPDADIFDTSLSYFIHVSLPGAKKEDVGVNWDAEKSELSVAGVIYRPGDEELLKTLAMSERKVGPFERKIRLGTRANPAHVDADGITAKLEDGVLRIEVRKEEEGFVEIKKVDIDPRQAAIMSLVSGEKSNFQYIIRLLNTNVDGKQKVMYALTKIKGVGRRYSNLVCKKADVDLTKRAGDLTSEELERIVTIIQNPLQYKIPTWFLNRQRDIVDGKDTQVLANGVDSKLRDDLERLKKIRAHRGLRHYWGLRVRGQHSKTTGRRGRTVGVSKKKG